MAKQYGIKKWGVIGKILGEHIENILKEKNSSSTHLNHYPHKKKTKVHQSILMAAWKFNF
jgi:hypothetical protein